MINLILIIGIMIYFGPVAALIAGTVLILAELEGK